MLTGILITAIVALVVGGAAGYGIFRYVIKGKYNEMIAAANKEAEVVKEKKLLEVKEKFLNKKSELEKEVQQRNQKIQQNENRLKQREISLQHISVLHILKEKQQPGKHHDQQSRHQQEDLKTHTCRLTFHHCQSPDLHSLHTGSWSSSVHTCPYNCVQNDHPAPCLHKASAHHLLPTAWLHD